MVTLQEIEEREEELKVIEVQAIEASKTPIPERRYGVGVTIQQQQAAQARRVEGIKVRSQIEGQRKELKDIRGQIEQQKAAESQRQAEISYIQRQEELNNIAYNLVTRGKGYAARGDPELSSRIRQLEKYQSNVSKEKYKVEQKYLEQGLKPVYLNGKLIGFEDTIRQQSIGLEAIPKLPGVDLLRYEKAGVITLQYTTTTDKRSIAQILNPNLPQDKYNAFLLRQEETKMSVLPKAPYQPFFGKVEDIIKWPFEKLANLSERQYVNSKYEVGFGIIKPLKEGETLDPSQQFEPKAIRFVGDLAAFPVYGLKQAERIIFDKEGYRQEFASLPPGQKTLEVLNIGLSFYAFESLARSSIKYFKKPVNIKEEIKLPEQYFAETKVSNIRINEKVVNIAEFKVIGISAPQRAVQIPKWEAILKGLRPNDIRLQKYSLEQLNLMMTKGKIVELRPLRITQSVTEPFIIKNGRIINALGRRGEPGVFTFRQNIYTLTGKTRFTSKKLSILSGETYESRALRTISEGKGELSPNVKKALEEIESIPSPKEFKIKEVFNKELELQTGGVRLEDFLKLNTRGFKIIPKGKRISRAEVSAIQKSLLEVKFEGREYGLKEFELLGEKLGVIDTTFPRFRAPKKAIKIKGVVKRSEFELPYTGPSDVKVYYPGTGPKTKLTFEDNQNLKLIQEAVGSLAVRQSKLPSAKINMPKIENVLEPVQRSLPAYAGTGLYERTEETGAMNRPYTPQSIRDVEIIRYVPSYKPAMREVQLPSLDYGQKNISRDITKEITKDITKEINKSLPKLSPKEINKEINKEISKQVFKLNLKSAEKNINKFNAGFPRIPKSEGKTIKIPSIRLKGEGQPKDLVPGYKPFVIKKGEKFYLDDVLPRGKALKKAEEEAKRTLRATFGIEPAKVKVKDGDINYTPSKKLFRAFRIREGKKIPLKDTFIQKLGKRLSSKGEISEIQIARKFKL